jgi:hypothetical protein
METLLKTGDTKSPFRKGLTLLFYIALHCMKTKPSCLDLPKEYEPVGEAFSYPFDMLTGDVAKIVKDIDGMLKYAEEAKQCKDPADKWEDQISGFAKKMEMNKAMLDGLITRLGEMSKRLCVQFADPPSEKAMDDIFKKLSTFVGMFAAGVQFLEDEEARRLKELEKARKAAEKEKKKAEKKAAAEAKKKKAAEKKSKKDAGGDDGDKKKEKKERKPKKEAGGGEEADDAEKAAKAAERKKRRAEKKAKEKK